MTQAKSLIQRYYDKYNFLPTKKFLSNKLNISVEGSGELLKKLIEDGFIKKNASGHYYVEKKAEIIKIDPVIEKVEPEPEPTKEEPAKDYMTLFLRGVLLLVGFLAALYSVYYTTNFLADYLPPILDLGLSLTMVLGSVASFEFILIFYEKKRYAFSIAFLLVGLIVFCFSILSTVAGQYNARMIKNADDREEIKSVTTWEIVKAEEETLISDKEKAKNEFQELNKKLESFEEKNWEYWDTFKKLNSAEKVYKEKESKLEDKRAEMKSFLKSGNSVKVKRKIDFFTDLGKVLKQDPEALSFLVSLFPATIIDIIAPLFIAAAMFLRRKETA